MICGLCTADSVMNYGVRFSVALFRLPSFAQIILLVVIQCAFVATFVCHFTNVPPVAMSKGLIWVPIICANFGKRQKNFEIKIQMTKHSPHSRTYQQYQQRNGAFYAKMRIIFTKYRFRIVTIFFHLLFVFVLILEFLPFISRNRLVSFD